MEVERHSGDTEIAIIGAGAAGIGAGCVLAAANIPFVILEAGPRVGGRSWSVDLEGYPVDLGCGWLHSANTNPWTELAEQLGLTVDRAPPHWERQSYNLGMSAGAGNSFRRAWGAAEKAFDNAPLDHDVAAISLVNPHEPWLPLMQSLSTYINAATLDELSIFDLRNYEDTEINWRVVEGYGSLIAAAAEPLPVALGCAVTGISHGGRELRLTTGKGELRARKVIVTVSTNALASEAIRFRPALPEKLQAANNLPLGIVNKAFFRCDLPLVEDGHLFGLVNTADTGSYHLRPFGRPLIEGFFAGNVARELARESEAGLLDFGFNELVSMLGSDARKAIRPLRASGWGEDPFIRGSYSHAKVGHSGARAVLAADVDQRIFFAGEATSKHGFSTAHGAYLSGVAAARRAL